MSLAGKVWLEMQRSVQQLTQSLHVGITKPCGRRCGGGGAAQAQRDGGVV